MQVVNETVIALQLRHPNIVTVMGTSVDPHTRDLLLVTALLERGTLYDLLHNDTVSSLFSRHCCITGHGHWWRTTNAYHPGHTPQYCAVARPGVADFQHMHSQVGILLSIALAHKSRTPHTSCITSIVLHCVHRCGMDRLADCILICLHH